MRCPTNHHSSGWRERARWPPSLRAHEWAATPLGPSAEWPPSLRSIVAMLLASGFPMLALWGPDLIQIYNDGYRDLLGSKHPAGLGQAARGCWPEGWPSAAPICQRVLAGETVRLDAAQHPLIQPGTQEDAWFALSYSPLRDEAGAIAGVLVMAIERVRAEHALRISESRYRTIFENMTEGFAICGALRDAAGQVVDLRYLEMNYALEQQTGLERRMLLGRTLSEILPPADMERWIANYAGVVEGGEPVAFEEYVVLLDRWFAVTVSPRPGDELAVFYRDITERKHDEQRQAFLLALSDELRVELSADAVADRAVTMLAEHLRLDRCWISEVFEERGISTVGPERHRPDLPPMAGVFQLADYPETMRQLVTQPMVIADVAADPRFAAAEQALLAGLHLRSLLVAPLRTGPRPVIWAIAAAMATPRRWTDGERLLLEDIAERTWAAMERARADAALRESEQRLRSMAENLPGGAAFIVDRDLRYMLAEGESLRAIGATPDQYLGKTIHEALPPQQAAEYERRFRQAFSGTAFTHEHQSDGRSFISRGVPLRDETNAIYAVLVVSYDITERKQAEQALQLARDELELRVQERTAELAWLSRTRQELLQRLVSSQEAERRRIARELHDSLGQLLTAFNLRLALVERRPDMPPPLADELGQLRAMVRQLEVEVDQLTAQLRPAGLEHLGLVDALARYGREWTRTSGIPVAIYDQGMDGERLPAVPETTAYRVVQEAPTNVLKHAQASQVSIVVERTSALLSVIIEDNGVGFEVETLGTASADGRQVGLVGMQERAALAGGAVQIESSPGLGTTVYLRIPLPLPADPSPFGEMIMAQETDHMPGGRDVEQDRRTAEFDREAHEHGRQYAEARRVLRAEQQAHTATLIQQAEDKRQAAEEQRQIAEEGRGVAWEVQENLIAQVTRLHQQVSTLEADLAQLRGVVAALAAQVAASRDATTPNVTPPQAADVKRG